MCVCVCVCVCVCDLCVCVCIYDLCVCMCVCVCACALMGVCVYTHMCVSRVSDQNGVSLLYIVLEIHHSGREPSICILAYMALCCVQVGRETGACGDEGE